MKTNTLNKHLENKTNQDIKEMVTKIMKLLEQFNDETFTSNIRKNDTYYISGEVFEMLTTKYSNSKSKQSSITYMNNGQVALNGKWLNEFFLDLFRVRFFDKVLDNRTKDLLNKVELLD